ncbi:Cell division control protein 7 [Savitreella phatthalungensis]
MDEDGLELPLEREEQLDFLRVTQRYRLLSKIGEGTFSTVYRARDQQQQRYENEWLRRRGLDTSKQWDVAIKRIYVTSSPARIYNEIDILKSLVESDYVLPIITAFRQDDQVYVVLPFYRHVDFRHYYRELPLREVRYYMRALFRGLQDVHEQGVIHRDVKPSNFLYDYRERHGELVDFGLAERMHTATKMCPCQTRSGRDPGEALLMANPTHTRLRGVYIKDDPRPGKRANRAGTRGFRSPEVLFKCDNQTTAVDVWAAGVILLTFLSSKFPFFNAADDVEALVELCCIWGTTEMRNCAALHNVSVEVDLPTLYDKQLDWPRLLNWCEDPNRKGDPHISSDEMQMAIDFLDRCLCLDPWQRWSASEALEDWFLAGIESDELADEAEEGTVASEADTAQDIAGCEDQRDMPTLDSPLKMHAPPRILLERSANRLGLFVQAQRKDLQVEQTCEDEDNDEDEHDAATEAPTEDLPLELVPRRNIALPVTNPATPAAQVLDATTNEPPHLSIHPFPQLPEPAWANKSLAARGEGIGVRLAAERLSREGLSQSLPTLVDENATEIEELEEDELGRTDRRSEDLSDDEEDLIHDNNGDDYDEDDDDGQHEALTETTATHSSRPAIDHVWLAALLSNDSKHAASSSLLG